MIDYISFEEGKHILDTCPGSVLLDVRTEEEYGIEHAAGAVLLPQDCLLYTSISRPGTHQAAHPDVAYQANLVHQRGTRGQASHAQRAAKLQPVCPALDGRHGGGVGIYANFQ